MNIKELEELYLRSLDQTLSPSEKEQLEAGLRANPELAAEVRHYDHVRAMVQRKEAATFGPYFAQKVIDKLQTVKVGIDRQILIFFKRYQLAAIGLAVLLITLNVLSAEKLDLPSVLGLEETVTPDNTPADEDLLSFDLYENLNNN
jgi:hypothetical protein